MTRDQALNVIDALRRFAEGSAIPLTRAELCGAIDGLKALVSGPHVVSADPLILAKEERAFWDARFESHFRAYGNMPPNVLVPGCGPSPDIDKYNKYVTRLRDLASSAAEADLAERRRRFSPPDTAVPDRDRVRTAIEKRLQYAPPNEVIFRRPDGSTLTAADALASLKAGDPAINEFVDDVVGAALRIVRIGAAKRDPKGA